MFHHADGLKAYGKDICFFLKRSRNMEINTGSYVLK